MFLAVLAILGWSALSNADRQQGLPVSPTLSVSEFDSVSVIGQPIAFTLSLSNPGGHSVMVVPFTDDMVHDVMTLVASVTSPDGQQFKCLAANTRSYMVFIEPSQVTDLQAAETVTLPVQWEIDDPWEDSRWHVFSEDEWAAFRREHHYTVDDDVIGRCFRQPGVYEISFSLDMTPYGGMVWPPLPGGTLWTGVLETPEITVTLVDVIIIDD